MASAPGDLQTVDELMALASLEPDIRIVLVEGRADARFFGWYLDTVGAQASVVAIGDRLYVPSSEVDVSLLDYGEREKLNVVARRVAESLPADQRVITVVLDADWADVTGPVGTARACVLATDGPSVEFYFMARAPFERFATLGLQVAQFNYEEMISSIFPVLQEVASVRLVLQLGSISCIANFSALCDFTPTPKANVAEILRRSADRVPRVNWPCSVNEMTIWAEFYLQMLREADHPGRGHDIAPLLIRYFNLSGSLAQPDTVERLMRATAHPAELHDFPLFASLRVRLGLAA